MSEVSVSRDRVEALRAACGAEEVELYVKRGRSRRFVRAAGLEHSSEAMESGWAVRASTARGSFFRCGTGTMPKPTVAWPEPDGRPLRFPEPATVPAWKVPPDMEAPLASEHEIRAIVDVIESELRRSRPDGRIDYLALEDGQSESRIGNTHGLLTSWRGRAASLVVEISSRQCRGETVRIETVQRELRELAPRRLASRLIDQLTVMVDGRPVSRDRSEMVIAPRVAARLLAGLTPLFDADRAAPLVEAMSASGKLGGPSLTLIDDGRLRNGVLAAAVDGEGTPTQEVVLVEEGKYRQPLLGWWMEGQGRRAGGCSRRFSWRDEPAVGPTHLYLQPDATLRATELVTSLSRGYYLLDCLGVGRFDWPADRFSLPVRGFEMLGGRARGAVSGVVLVGRISALLSGVRAAAGDLAWTPTAHGLFGAPTVRLVGLELRQAG